MPGNKLPLAVRLNMFLWRLMHKRYTLHIGPHTYGKPQIISFAGDNGSVTIGNYCSVARNVKIIVGGNHRTDWISTFPLRIAFNLPEKYEDGHPQSNGPVRIGNDVWLGYGCTIMSGITIGDGAVVASNSLVVKDIPPYAIAGGNPADIIKYRFEKIEIESLMSIRWWEWDDKRVLKNVDLICASNIKAFIDKHIHGSSL